MSGRGWITYGSSGLGRGHFENPRGVFVDPEGRIYIADTLNERIVRIDDMSGRGWSATNHFGFPDGVAVDAHHRIYVADTREHRVVRMDDLTGRGWVEWNTGRSSAPWGVTVDREGRIYATDRDSNNIVRIDDVAGHGIVAFGRLGGGTRKLAGPTGVAVDALNRIYIADTNNARIVRIDNIDGHGRADLVTTPQVFSFARPLGLALDPSGYLYIADSRNNRIVRIDGFSSQGWIASDIPGNTESLDTPWESPWTGTTASTPPTPGGKSSAWTISQAAARALSAVRKIAPICLPLPATLPSIHRTAFMSPTWAIVALSASTTSRAPGGRHWARRESDPDNSALRGVSPSIPAATLRRGYAQQPNRPDGRYKWRRLDRPRHVR